MALELMYEMSFLSILTLILTLPFFLPSFSSTSHPNPFSQPLTLTFPSPQPHTPTDCEDVTVCRGISVPLFMFLLIIIGILIVTIMIILWKKVGYILISQSRIMFTTHCSTPTVLAHTHTQTCVTMTWQVIIWHTVPLWLYIVLLILLVMKSSANCCVVGLPRGF